MIQDSHLYAPWRGSYIKGEKKIQECVFCQISKQLEKSCENVLFYDDKCFVVMNKYPYTPGHFMIIPHVHTDKLETLDSEVWLRISFLAQKGVALLKEAMQAHGVNIGMNLGEAGGAGIAEHIHLHLVPRWTRDTNFMTTTASTRVYSDDFETIFERLKEHALHYFVK